MTISNQSSEPWYADYANYLASRVLPFRSTRQEKQKFFNDLRHFFWDKPFLFKQCADQIIRRCVSGNEVAQKLRQCHSGLSGGHHGIATTARKFFEALDETPQKYIQVCEIFDVWVIDFMGPFPSSKGNKFILVAIDYVSKWVEAQAFPTSDARNVLNFLKKLFAHFGVPKALISNRGTRLCNYQMKRAMKRLFPCKLKSRFYGPFAVSKDMKNGAIKLCDEEGNKFIVNKQCVKPYQKDMSGFDADDDIILDDEGRVTKLLEDIHVTWTHLGKKRDKIAALQRSGFKNCSQSLETASQFLATLSEPSRDGVKKSGNGKECLDCVEGDDVRELQTEVLQPPRQCI
ncbi:reverse transcriptase domain-containing protein [Tanacetum coccineum]